jgi:hypothetical protein
MSDDFDQDRSELGNGFLEATTEELERMALRRAAATGGVVIVTAFTGGDTMTVHDVEGGELVHRGEVPLDAPSPSLALDADPEDAA